ncbi:MAG: hypothetical protein DI619_01185 [Francisella sp.]|nr:MAG: hypothetical protein DI619_01185 [Francisella sp.]
MILLASIFLLAPVHSIVIANPLIKINKGKAHQHHEAHKHNTSSKAKPRQSNTQSHYNHTNQSYHRHTQSTHAALRDKTIEKPQTAHQFTTPKVDRMTKVKTDHLQIN